MRYIFLFSFFFSSFSMASDYYWMPSGFKEVFPDAHSACIFLHSRVKDAGGLNLYPVGDLDSFLCEFSTPWSVTRHRINRYGKCQSEIDRINGACLIPLRDDCPVGDFSIFSSSSSPVISSGGLNYVVTDMPSSACHSRCSYSVSSTASSCYFDKGSTTSGFCNYTGSSTGDGCNDIDANLGSVGDSLNPPDTPDVPPSDPHDPGCPSGYSWTGSFCVKDSTPGDGDGGGDGGGTDPGGGDGGDGGGTGPGGDGDGEGGGTGPGGGGGTGPGEGEGEGEGDSSVGGEACNQPLVCEGDAIQCAILRSNKSQACQFQYDAPVKKAISDELAGDAYKLKEEKIDVSNFFTDALNKGRWLPSSCPPPEFFTVMGRSFSIQWEPLCRFASSIAPIIVAMASIFFAIFVSRGLKGS